MERIMQNRKWILTSLVMTFFGIPILAQFLAVVIAMLGVGLAGIIEVCNILITPTIYLLLKIFMLALLFNLSTATDTVCFVILVTLL